MKKKSKYYLMVLDRIEFVVENHTVAMQDMRTYLLGYVAGVYRASADAADGAPLTLGEVGELEEHIDRVVGQVMPR